jgi:hypothetical protein
MNVPIYIERFELNNSGKATVAMFKPVEHEDVWFGYWELDKELTESKKKQRLYFQLHNDGKICCVCMSDEVARVMAPYHFKFLKAGVNNYKDDDKCIPMVTPIVATAFLEIVMRRWDVTCKFMCPRLDLNFTLDCQGAVSKECESITVEAFAKTNVKLDSANVFFKMKSEGESLFHEVHEVLFQPLKMAA